MLSLRVCGSVERIAVKKRHEQSARRTDFFRDHPEQLNRHRRNAVPLQFRRYQAHGLVAHRSHRHQQRDIDAVLDQRVRGLRHEFLYEPPRRGERTHERKMTPVH